jgi:hypothetical protein
LDFDEQAGSREVLEIDKKLRQNRRWIFVLKICVIDGRVELKMLDKLRKCIDI